MKKILFSVLFLMMIFHQRSNAQLLPNFGQNQNTWVLKYSRAFNGEHSFSDITLVKKNGRVEEQDSYLFEAKFARGRNVNVIEFYTLDRNSYTYKDPNLFNGIAVDEAGLERIVYNMSARELLNYLFGLKYVYIIDLDSRNRLNPNECKVIRVRYYYPCEHSGFCN
jgi:hypothetical protein